VSFANFRGGEYTIWVNFGGMSAVVTFSDSTCVFEEEEGVFGCGGVILGRVVARGNAVKGKRLE
jgi:hypothetical protein